MKQAKKIVGKQVTAYELGARSDMERELIRKGLLRETAPGMYELISQEVAVAFLNKVSLADMIARGVAEVRQEQVKDRPFGWMLDLKIVEVPGAWSRMMELTGMEVSGQQAKKGDFFKVDGAGFPYHNEREWFEANHRHLEGDTYEQLPKPLEIWMADDGENEVISWLVEQGKLILREDAPDRFFNAHLWGADLAAHRDAVVVFYGVQRDENGAITDVDFNFVARPEFDRDYVICG